MDNINLNNIKNKRVLVVGLGRSGLAAVTALLRLEAEVSVQDAKDVDKIDGQLLNFLRGKGVKIYLGTQPEDMGAFDMLVLSPGVDPELAFIRAAEEAGAEIIGELEIAFRIARGHFVAITGTNGKTTTTALTGEIFKKAGRTTHVVGNIGVAVISKAIEAETEDWLITETSSFQLQTTKYFKPVISAILNVTPDHLNRHHTMENYGLAKARVFANQDAGGYCVLNAEDEICRRLSARCRAQIIWFSSARELEKGAFLKDGRLMLATEEGRLITLCRREELKIIGLHNVENALAAAAIAYYAGIEPEIISQVLKSFAGVAHRIEYCGTVNGVKFYNDSKGTNVDASLTALAAIEKNILLIAGGDGKGQDFAPLAQQLAGRVKKLVLLGRDGPKIAAEADKAGFKDYVYGVDMGDCVRKAFAAATAGDTVLLSPACASWDMYDNYEQRGDHFKELVSKLGV